MCFLWLALVILLSHGYPCLSSVRVRGGVVEVCAATCAEARQMAYGDTWFAWRQIGATHSANQDQNSFNKTDSTEKKLVQYRNN